ncbi:MULTISPECIES: hypothetical protein [Pasteurellaceae]|uniref:hypothetical protein n=1 Tax=Pasteurellaceae TaxID=712 RepID=UPI00351E2179
MNKAVKNNPDKFPSDYVIIISKEDKKELVKNFYWFHFLKHSSIGSDVLAEDGKYTYEVYLLNNREKLQKS